MNSQEFESYKATLPPDDAFLLEERASIIQADRRCGEEEANELAVKIYKGKP